MYDRISRWYTALEGIWEKRLRDVGLRKLAVREGEDVLEIGPGPGQDLLGLARSVGQAGRVFGLDLSSAMLHIARQKAESAGLTRRMGLGQGDAEYLPFEDASFDAVFMSFTLELFDTPAIPRTLAEARRVLRSGGRLCVVALSKAGRSTWMRRLYEWGHQHFPQLLDCRPIFVASALDAAGMEILDATRQMMFGLPVEVVLARNAS